MLRLLLMYTPNRHPDAEWDTRDAAIAACPGAAPALEAFGASIALWPGWVQTVPPPPDVGWWVWTGRLQVFGARELWIDEAHAWRRPTTAELRDMVAGANPFDGADTGQQLLPFPAEVPVRLRGVEGAGPYLAWSRA